MRALLLLATAVGVLGGRLSVVTQDGHQGIWQWAVDPATGETQGEQLKFADGGDWQVVNGNHGQNSDVFFENSSLFLVAENSTGNVALFQVAFGGNVHQLADLTDMAKAAGGAKAFHVGWDMVCNVIVTAPTDGGKVVKQYEISEYDGQVRPLANQTLAAGWEQENGFFAVRSPLPHWDRARRRGTALEEKCDDCTTYTLETPNGAATKPNMVARWLQNGSLAFNTSDDQTRLRTMSFVLRDMFIGLGECCDLRGCPERCEGHGGELSLVLYQGKEYPVPSVVATLNGTIDDDTALRLGVAVDNAFPDQPSGTSVRVSVMSGGQIITYRIDESSYYPTAVFMSKSPKVSFPYGQEPVMWAYTGN